MPDLRSELARLLHAATSARERRVEVWRDIVDPDDTVVATIYRGSYIAPETSPTEQEPV